MNLIVCSSVVALQCRGLKKFEKPDSIGATNEAAHFRHGAEKDLLQRAKSLAKAHF
jgi:hypothetical protein